ncbi:hypothetical protein [Teredinibacter franksiae]|uniref:hypothetical protein n=1 Tax=Teredinibacter franksiae TaxID=2761453 RepID=UPI00162487A0|nr:hypothetical protein [Teredinibacter franksiae]
MPDNLLIVIHGMGKHTASSFKSEVVNGCNNALHRYSSYSGKKIENEVHIESIGYDAIFDKLRAEYAESGKTLTQFITDGSAGGDLPGFVDELTGVQAELGDDQFLYTHVLDVLFYLTLVGEKVRLSVAEQFVEAVKKYPAGTRINVVAHSLGTAVMHDTLNKLYSTGYKTATGDRAKSSGGHDIYLDPFTLPVDMYWAFANVSPIITKLSGLSGPADSIVKPGDGGCLGSFLNTFHEFDPFTLAFINRFDPQEGDGWVDPMTYQIAYKRYKTTKVARKNTHSVGGYIEVEAVGGYLEDPEVCHDFLRSLMDFNPSAAEKTVGDAAYKNLQDETQKIRGFIEQLQDLTNVSDLKKLVKLLLAYRTYVESANF